MPNDNFELSRRKVLGGLGAIGLTSAGAGLGTSAYFSDTETFANNALVAGELDMTVGYSAHYSDWSPDEGEGVEVRMWDGPAGTTGGPGDLVEGETGLPSNAAWLIAVDDPDQFLANTQYSDPALDGASCEDRTDAEDLEQPVIELEDVKPGDFGEVTFDFALCDNPGYVWLQAGRFSASDNGHTEPELDDEDESGPVEVEGFGELDMAVELLDVVQAAYWIDDGDNYQDGDETPAAVGSLREIIGQLSGLGAPLEGDLAPGEGGGADDRGCFSAETEHSVVFAWWVPVDHGNEIQTDSVEFGLQFYTEQCRHNDGSGDALTAFLNDEAEYKDAPIWTGDIVDRTGESGPVVIENGATTSVTVPSPPGGLPVAFDPMVVRVSTGTTVQWEWMDTTPQVPHNVISVEMDGGAPLFANPEGVVYQPGLTYDYTFTEPGVYPYYCTPHGAPFPVGSVFGGEVLNEFGMRGAVIVEE